MGKFIQDYFDQNYALHVINVWNLFFSMEFLFTSVQQCVALFSSASRLTEQEQHSKKALIRKHFRLKTEDSGAINVGHLLKFVQIIGFLMKVEPHQFTLEAFQEGAATEKIPDDAVRERVTVQLQISCTQ